MEKLQKQNKGKSIIKSSRDLFFMSFKYKMRDFADFSKTIDKISKREMISALYYAYGFIESNYK